MSLDTAEYVTLVFDCDGVVLDSNRLKTEAFRAAAQPWGAAAAEALVAHHVANGGVSRYAKFAHFLEHILPGHASDAVPGCDGPDLQAMLSAYAEYARAGLMTCAVAEGLAELRAATPDARWMIVSGGDQTELREIFAARGLADYFDGGIFGSPDTKDTILSRERAIGTICQPAIFIGDSKLDHQVAKRSGVDFVFLYAWSEVPDWPAYVEEHDIHAVRSIGELTKKLSPLKGDQNK